MAVTIKHPEADAEIRLLARRRGVSLTDAVLMAVRYQNTLDRQNESFDSRNAAVMAMADAIGSSVYDADDQKMFADANAGA
jgi:hypothetical protein